MSHDGILNDRYRYNEGQKVRVVLPGDPYTGRVGFVQRTFRHDGDQLVYVVQFRGEPDDYPRALFVTAYYMEVELTSAEVGAGDTENSATNLREL